MNLKHIEQIKNELSDYNLVPADLTAQELADYDRTIETELNGGTVIDGIRSILPEKSYSKQASNKQ